MLNQWFFDPIPLGLAQAAITALLALGVILLAGRYGIHLERETGIALVRGFVQVAAVGSIVLLLLQGPLWSSALVLLAMVFIAAVLAARQAADIPGAFWVNLGGIGLGAGLVIVGMTWLGVIDPAPSSLIPVGSMLIANAMKTSNLALNRLQGEVESHVGQIEAALALGAEPRRAVARYVQAAVRASLLPSLDSLRSLGIVWIPGLMAGMILSGSDPVYAAIYQFVVLAMIMASAALASAACTLLIRGQIFTSAQQLILRTEKSR